MILNYVDKLIQEVAAEITAASELASKISSKLASEFDDLQKFRSDPIPIPDYLKNIPDEGGRAHGVIRSLHNMSKDEILHKIKLTPFTNDDDIINSRKELEKVDPHIEKVRHLMDPKDQEKYDIIKGSINKVHTRDELEDEIISHKKHLHDAVDRQKYIGLGVGAAAGLGGYALGRKKKS